MKENQASASGAVAAVAVLVLAMALAMAYTASYFALSYPACDGGPSPTLYRIYDSEWMVRIYRPAAYIESRITGRETCVLTQPDDP